jgi:hypothetical protein
MTRIAVQCIVQCILRLHASLAAGSLVQNLR